MWVLVSVTVFQLTLSSMAAPAFQYRKANSGIYHESVSGRERRAPFVEVRNATYHGLGPREEAKAMCSVHTQEVNATANATITRRLHGVVTSRELHSSIQRLELIIFGQMQQLWQSLDAVRSHLDRIAGGAGGAVEIPNRRTVSLRYQPQAG